MNFQNCFPPANIRSVDQDISIKSTGTQECLIQSFRAVGCGHHDDTGVGVEAVHFDKQCVERLLSLIMAADRAAAPRFSQGIEFVDKDDAGGFRYGLLKHVPHSGRANANKHLNEIASRKAEKWDARLASDCFGKQGFARSRRTNQQDAFWNSSPQSLILFGRAEEIHDFLHFVNRFVDPSDVVEGDTKILLSVESPAAATKTHRRAGSAHSAENEHDAQQQNTGHDQ